MQIQDNRHLLEKASAMISQKAYTFVGQAIERTLQDWRLGDIQSEDGDFGRGPRGAFAGEKGVSVDFAWVIYTQWVPYRASRF